MYSNSIVEIQQLHAPAAQHHLASLARVLVACVNAGASVSFMAGLSQTDAENFFTKVIESVESGDRILLAAFLNQELVGTVQVALAMPPNQPHRGEIAKLLVTPAARSQGIGRKLMQHAEQVAINANKTLLVLDTADPHAEKLYTSLGWTKLGVIPDYALLPNGEPCGTTVFWKRLLVT